MCCDTKVPLFFLSFGLYNDSTNLDSHSHSQSLSLRITITHSSLKEWSYSFTSQPRKPQPRFRVFWETQNRKTKMNSFSEVCGPTEHIFVEACQISNSMQQSPSWKSNSRTPNQKIYTPVIELEASLQCSQEPATDFHSVSYVPSPHPHNPIPLFSLYYSNGSLSKFNIRSGLLRLVTKKTCYSVTWQFFGFSLWKSSSPRSTSKLKDHTFSEVPQIHSYPPCCRPSPPPATKA